MTVALHRHNDSRGCGAKTIVIGQSTVFANQKLVAVENDPESHGGGNLISATNHRVYANNKKVIFIDDHASGDSAGHNPPSTYPTEGSPNVFG